MDHIVAFDTAVEHFLALHRTAFWDSFFVTITNMSGIQAAIVWSIIMVILASTRSTVRGYAHTALITLFGATLLKELIQNTVARVRPEPISLYSGIEHSYSFPSGHALSVVILYAFAAYIICRYVTHPYVKVMTWTLAVIIISFVAVSRLYLRVHYASDVIAGIVLGVGCVLSGFLIHSRTKQHE